MWIVLPCLFMLMIVGMIGSANEKAHLREMKVECSKKFDKTADYLQCLKPIEEREEQIRQDEEDAALVSASVTMATVATMQ